MQEGRTNLGIGVKVPYHEAICAMRLTEVAEDAERWVSLREAARIIGRDDSTVLTYVKRGAIEQRNAPRNQASLSRSSVERFARARRARHLG